MKHILCLICLLCLSVLSFPQGVNAQPMAEVEAAVVQFLDAISNKDSTAFRDVMLPEGAAIALFTRDQQPAYRWRTVEGDVQMIGNATSSMLERMWEPEIKVDGLLASVWTRYDFYVDGAFSHCGTDAFHVIKTQDGWKIASVIYTIESDVEKCPESPLGPPAF